MTELGWFLGLALWSKNRWHRLRPQILPAEQPLKISMKHTNPPPWSLGPLPSLMLGRECWANHQRHQRVEARRLVRQRRLLQH